MIMIGLFPCSNASCFPAGSPYRVSTDRPWSSSSPDLTFPSNLRTTVFLVWLGVPSFFQAFSWRHPLAVGCLETSYVVISYNLELVRSVFRSTPWENFAVKVHVSLRSFLFCESDVDVSILEVVPSNSFHRLYLSPKCLFRASTLARVLWAFWLRDLCAIPFKQLLSERERVGQVKRED